MSEGVFWRQLKHFPEYEVNVLGSVRKIDTGEQLYSFKEYGSNYVILRVHNTPVTMLNEVLVLQAFPGLQAEDEATVDRVISEEGVVSGTLWHQGEDTPVRDDKQYFWIVTEQGFPHGLACMECQRSIDIGQPYRNKLNGMFSDGIPLDDLVCVYC